MEMECYYYLVSLMKKFAILFGIITLFAACTQQPQKIVLEGLAQGSYYAVTYFDEQNRNFQHNIDSIFHAVDISVNLWVDSSVISKVNRNEEVTLDSIFIDNFNIAQEAARLSDGYFESGIILDGLMSTPLTKVGAGVFYRYGPYAFDNIWSNFAWKWSATITL